MSVQPLMSENRVDVIEEAKQEALRLLPEKPPNPFTVDALFTQGNGSQVELSTKKHIMQYCQALFPSLDASKIQRLRQSVDTEERREDIKREMECLLNILYGHEDGMTPYVRVAHLDARNTKKPFDFMLLVLRRLTGREQEQEEQQTPPPSADHDMRVLAERVAGLELKHTFMDDRVTTLEEEGFVSREPKRKKRVDGTQENEWDEPQSLAPRSPPADMETQEEETQEEETQDTEDTTLDDASLDLSGITFVSSQGGDLISANSGRGGNNAKSALQEKFAKLFPSAARPHYPEAEKRDCDSLFRSDVIVAKITKHFSVKSLRSSHSKKREAVADANSVLYEELKEFLDMLAQSSSLSCSSPAGSVVPPAASPAASSSKSAVKVLLDKHRSLGSFVDTCQPTEASAQGTDKCFSTTIDLTIHFQLAAQGGWKQTKKEAQADAAGRFLSKHWHFMRWCEETDFDFKNKIKYGIGSFDRNFENMSMSTDSTSVSMSIPSSGTPSALTSIATSSTSVARTPATAATAGQQRVQCEAVVQERFGASCSIQYAEVQGLPDFKFKATVSVTLPVTCRVVETGGSKKQAENAAAEALLCELAHTFQQLGGLAVAGSSARQKVDNFISRDPSSYVKWETQREEGTNLDGGAAGMSASSSVASRAGSDGSGMHSASGAPPLFVFVCCAELFTEISLAGEEGQLGALAASKQEAKLTAIQQFCSSYDLHACI